MSGNKGFTNVVIVLFILGAVATYFVFNTKVRILAPNSSPTPDEASDWNTFFSQEYELEIKYPKNFEVGESTLIFLPGLVRISAPQDLFPGTNLIEAYVSLGVGEQPEVPSLPSSYCYKNPDTGATLAKTENINGAVFYKGDASGVGLGNLYESTIYRILKSDKCYEIVVTIHTGNVGNYPEGTVVEFDRNLILPTLNQMVHTLKFKN